MKTNLNRTINTVEEAKAFLRELFVNKEDYHTEDDAHQINWCGQQPTEDECDKLNVLMEQVNVLGCDEFDPCGFLIDLTHEHEEYFVKDTSGRGFATTITYAELRAWSLDEYEQEEQDEFNDWLHDNSKGDSFELGTNHITRTK